MKIFLLICMIAITLNSVNAKSLIDNFPSFCESLELVKKSTLESSLGAYSEFVFDNEGLNIATVRAADYEHSKRILDKAIEMELGSLVLFSDESFTENKQCILFFNEDVLRQINQHYNIHAPWMINAVNDQKNMFMQYLLVGNGKLIVGYPGATEIIVEDYRIFTGKFKYAPYTSMDIINDGSDRGLFKIRTRASPSSELDRFRGPLNTEVLDLILVNNSKMFVNCRNIFQFRWELEPIPIERR